MTAAEYIAAQPEARQSLLTNIHQIIINEDKTVEIEVDKMMGKEMIIYKANKVMKYALSSVKDYMSLHVLPMYGWPAFNQKFSKWLSKASFQKGCINFKTADEMPLDIVTELLKACAPVDLKAVMDELKKNREKK